MFQIAQFQTVPEIINVIKVLITGLIAFLLAFSITPLWTYLLYKYKIGIKIKKADVNGEKLTFINRLHANKTGTPTMGGVIIWAAILILVLASHFIFPWIAEFFNIRFVARLDFFSRPQVWLPLFALITAGILGLFDDIMSVRGWGHNKGGGMRFAMRFGWLILIAAAGAWWFYEKLGWDRLHIPAVGDITMGLWYIPLFIFVILFAAISSNETDGLDGLAVGLLIICLIA